jgi:hypothetical protein
MTNTPPTFPPACRWDACINLDWMTAGICSWNKPNIDNDSPTINNPNVPSTQGFWKAATNPSPARPAATPSKI